jgi:hypothetical protein
LNRLSYRIGSGSGLQRALAARQLENFSTFSSLTCSNSLILSCVPIKWFHLIGTRSGVQMAGKEIQGELEPRMSGALRRAGHIPLGTPKGVGRVLGKSSSTPMRTPASPSSMIARRRLWPPISNRSGLALPRGERRPTAACPRRSRHRIARHPRPPRMRTPPRRQEHRSSLRQPFDHASLGGTFGWLRPHQARSPQITGIVERYRNTMIDAFPRIAFRLAMRFPRRVRHGRLEQQHAIC